MVSYIHHSRKKAGVGVQFWNWLDTVLAFSLFVFGSFVVINLSKNATTREAIGPGLLSVNFIVGLYSVGIFILSRFAAAKTKIEKEVEVQENTGWTANYHGECDDQRYETDYLALHSTWHSLSGISILLTIIIIQIALKSNL